jgi:predicted Zn-dependent protease
VNRRGFLAAGCACCAAAAGAAAYAQSEWHTPPRLTRPEISTDEGGLWALMDREETRLRRSPFALRDPQLHEYVQGIACRLAGAHCPDIRVYIVQTPVFNANMAPNGMMQVWTGLLLRVENEAQLAAVIGHEIGHYMARHTVERMRDVKSRLAFGQFIGLLGVVGAVGQLAVLASLFAYSRDQEREADRIGVTLMHEAGYDPAEAAKVWGNLLLEISARPGADPARSSPMLATHPSPQERQDNLKLLAQSMPGGAINEEVWREKTRTFMFGWISEEVRRGQHEESIALFTRMIVRSPEQAQFVFARGEVYRLRATGDDLNAALADYDTAITLGNEPPATYRGRGLIYRQRNQAAAARESFQRYIELAPAAPDSALIKSYMEETGT